MVINSAQIRAARALLDWSQQDLATRTGLSKTAIANIETEKYRPTPENQQKITEVFEKAGIEFIAAGVRRINNLVKIYEGENCYLDFLQAAYVQLVNEKQPEILFSGADDRRSPAQIVNILKSLKQAGIRTRSLIRHADTFIHGALEDYRWLPKGLFIDANVKIIYGKSVAYLVTWREQKRVVVFNDAMVHQEARLIFDFLWGIGEKPDYSSAEVRV
jgi:transcriptional regulator with XRE-family HTH domain